MLPQSSAPHCTIRPAHIDDLHYVFQTFIREARSAPFNQGVDNILFAKKQHDLIARLLGSCPVLVAANPEDTFHIFGYCVYQLPNVIHFVYVRGSKLYRQQGLAHQLIASALPGVEKLLSTHFPPTKNTDLRITYDPFLLMGL